MRREAEDRFQRLLRWYPTWWRKENGEVFVGSLRDHTDHAQRVAPSAAESFSAFVNGIGLRLDALLGLWAALVAIGLGAGSWLLLLSGLGGTGGVGGVVGIVTVGVAPALALVALIALVRDRGWITAPGSLIVLLTLLVALALAALTQLSWTQGFRLADENLPQTGLAGAWSPLFVAAWAVGAAGIALFIDGALHRTRWPWFARIPLGAFVGVVTAPAIGVGLINPTMSTAAAGVGALMALSALSGRRVRSSPTPAGTGGARSPEVRSAVRWLSGLSAIAGVAGIAYALTGAGWSAGAVDGSAAMGQGITILLAAAIPLLSAVALSASQRHGRAAVWGPIGLGVLELTAVAIAYLNTPAWENLTMWMGASAALGGGAVAWWTIPRLRGPLGLRIAVGVALGAGYAALFGTTVIPMLAFAVPILAVVVAFVGTHPRRAMTAPGAPDATPALSA